VSSSGTGNRLRVISYNIRYDSVHDVEFPWAARRGQVVKLLRFHAPDLFGLQEATPQQVDDIAADMGERYRWIGEPRDGGNSGEMTPLFYRKDRFESTQERTRWLSQEPLTPGSLGWDADVPRTVVSAQLVDRRKHSRLGVYNCHLDNVGRTAVEESLKLLRSWVNTDADESEAFLLLGDLNFTPEDALYRRMCSFARDAATTARYLSYGPDYTYIGPGFEVTRQPGTRYDYIFVGSSIAVDTYAVLTDSQEGRYHSDHLPLLVDLSLEGAGDDKRK
jgi:endonuclease/exonuclease/phosphatase family metal-dependent hydrolase